MVNQDIIEYQQLLRDIENKELTRGQKQDMQIEIDKLQIKIRKTKEYLKEDVEEPIKTEIKNGGENKMKMLGIECKWECPACGNILTTNSPFWNKQHRKKVSEPKKCGCGRTAKFTLLSFKECKFAIVPAGYEVTLIPEEAQKND